jgi:hypothetical protein
MERRFLCALLTGVLAVPVCPANPNLEGQTERPLRYRPEGTDFVVENGAEWFNRPLYGGNTAFRVDAGDKPEFSLYLPGHGGNLRFGIKTATTAKWLFDADKVVARFRPGSMVYEIHDSLLGKATLELIALPLTTVQGLVVRAELRGPTTPIELVWACGGANGEKGQRGGDIGCEREPVGRFFQLKPDDYRGNTFETRADGFTMRSKPGTMVGIVPPDSKLAVGDAANWATLPELLASAGKPTEMPVVVGQTVLRSGQPLQFVLQRAPRLEHCGPKLFEETERHRRMIAEKIVVETPDPFINAAASALCVAADGVWDEHEGAFMHGAVAWRNKLLGWRGPYAGDALGWHDRMRRHLTYWASRQNTNAIAAALPPADPTANLSRNEPALHSNGDMSNSHYDMNLVYIDALFRHLLWTGDLDFARRMWPVIQRHLAWEQRLFRRPFGPDQVPLYEAYCCIWASDDLEYNGGGATHATAYNYYHNKMAARLAKLLGEDATSYEREADLILKAMQRELWLTNCGWYAECKDLLGLQLVHPNAGLWTFYHTVDSGAATPFEAWQMTRFVDTEIPHLPIHGPGVPAGDYCTLATTSWMPYTWSLNNVVMAEVAHSALAYWQAGRPDEAFRLFKGCVLDSMFMGLCPGNVGMTTSFDMARGEAQRDFADGIGVCSRALVEGLFGVVPDALRGEVLIRPGFPADWDKASLQHPDFTFDYKRDGVTEIYEMTPRFSKPMALRLQVAARRDRAPTVTVNRRPVRAGFLEDSVGVPRVEIYCESAPRYAVSITWRGERLAKPSHAAVIAQGAELPVTYGAARLLNVFDPQHALHNGMTGHRTMFAKVQQGDMAWWLPIEFEVRPASVVPDVVKKRSTEPSADWRMVDLSRVFNDKVTRIFQNDYLSPRSPFCSLAIPKQGIGSWCHPDFAFEVDDSGLRATAQKNGGAFVLPQGVPFQTPGVGDAKNVVFTSQWNNYPHEVSVPLAGKASRVYLLMAGSTNPMQSRFDNGEVIVTYTDGMTERLALRNPTNWWPIDEDYFLDDFAFRRPEPVPPRVDLKTGAVRMPDVGEFKGKGGKVDGGAATVLDLALDRQKELRSVTVRTLANDVVIGLMAVTLAEGSVSH